MAETVLPGSVARRCVRMVHGMGLHVGGVDLRRRPDGGWVCFEVNPSPAFTFFANRRPGNRSAARSQSYLFRLPVAEVLQALTGFPQSWREASRAPSAMAWNLAQTMSGSTRERPANVPNPQSVPASTFSRPTKRA